MKVARRTRASMPPQVVDEAYVLLPFADGLVVDPRNCPRRIPRRSHWTAGLDGSAVCDCNAEPIDGEPIEATS